MNDLPPPEFAILAIVALGVLCLVLVVGCWYLDRYARRCCQRDEHEDNHP